MKNLKNNSAAILAQIHGLTFTVFFIVEKLLNEFAYPYMEAHMAKPLVLVISAVIAATLYGGVFFIVKLIYDFILVKKNKKLAIDGIWYHVHLPHYMGKEDYTKTKISAGQTTVSRDIFDFTFVGDNEKFEVIDGEIVVSPENATHWYTKATKLSDENDFDLIEIYEAKTKGTPQRTLTTCPCCKTTFEKPIEIQEAERFRHGIHKIDIIMQGGKCIKMRGEYSDCWPSLNTGDLLFFRTEEERDKEVKRFFAAAERQRQEQANLSK